ncbi:hypothetical protein [Pseudooceanicola nanhaiensis]|uniref:hypothetical protein n=1 Tax=Pseudooceanicola nanhaiensis TaxID=375761 RepID=UPI001CD6F6C6|nr:hypothetical protein [Pseudooceanicola nanhaiensis]MCA0920223.1 hypothetical protein [Pseudooceanicola nanhaiensis]
MSNSKRGAIAFTACGAQHQIHLTTNAMVRYQDLAGETLIEGVQALQDRPGDIKRVRRIFFVGVDRDETMTEAEVGDLIDDLGLKETGDLIGKAVQAAFPKPPEVAADGEGAAGAAPGNAEAPAKPRKATATS